jgi:hypothetical protein
MRSHECRIQRWEDIDLANNRMTIRSNKTPAARVCPIFPELRPHLLRAREMAPAGAVFVQTRYTASDNILTTLTKIITRAGLVPWQKPLQNMRATRETELMAHYPVKDVSGWLGNNPAVVFKHYAMPMQKSFDLAVQQGAVLQGITAEVGNQKVPQKVPLNIPQTCLETVRQEKTLNLQTTENPVKSWDRLVASSPVYLIRYPRRDLNPHDLIGHRILNPERLPFRHSGSQFQELLHQIGQLDGYRTCIGRAKHYVRSRRECQDRLTNLFLRKDH